MKNWLLRASSVLFGAALAGTVACGSSSGCGGTNVNSNTAGTPSNSMECGQGTYLPRGGTQCLPLPSSNSNTSANNGSNATQARVISR